jgi:hypothetical protein
VLRVYGHYLATRQTGSFQDQVTCHDHRLFVRQSHAFPGLECGNCCFEAGGTNHRIDHYVNIGVSCRLDQTAGSDPMATATFVSVDQPDEVGPNRGCLLVQENFRSMSRESNNSEQISLPLNHSKSGSAD